MRGAERERKSFKSKAPVSSPSTCKRVLKPERFELGVEPLPKRQAVVMFETYGKQILFESCLSEYDGTGGIDKRASAPSSGSCSQRIAPRSTGALYANAGRGIPRIRGIPHGLKFDVQIVSCTAFFIRPLNGAIAPSRRLRN